MLLHNGGLRMLMAAPGRRWSPLLPGLLLCTVIGMAAAFVEMRWGGPKVLYALLMGMVFHEFSATPRQQAGVDFSAQTLLKLGIGLLGVRITLHELAALGWPTIVLIVAAVASTILCVAMLARGLSMSWRVGVIAGAATAICGASAAMAMAAVLARDRSTEQRALAIVVCATTLSTLAMFCYPLLSTYWALPPLRAGLLVGGGIHDVAQVAVAGYALGPQTGDLAVVVKLLRVAMLALVVLVASTYGRWHADASRSDRSCGTAGLFRHVRGDGGSATPWLPWFMRLFVALAILHSLGWLPGAVSLTLSDLSQCCLAIAAAGMGMRSSPQLLRQAGWPLMTAMLLGTLWLAACMLAGGYLLHGR